MHISNPSFKQNLLNQVKIKPQNTTSTTVTTPAKVADKSHTIDKKTLLGGIVALILAITAIIKRKNISKFFTKTKNGLKNNPNKSNKIKTVEEKAPKVKISLPTPKFTCGEENPIQFAKEKQDYINSIWNDFIHIDEPFVKANKEKNLLGLKALNQYGTVEDLRKLPREYRISEDSDIIEQYAKFVSKVGENYVDDYNNVEGLIYTYKDIYNDKAVEELMKAVKKYRVDMAGPGTYKNTSWSQYKDFEYYSKKDNKVISENAKAIMNRILEDNPWLQKIVSEQK